MRIILASGSPRRKELMEMLKIEDMEIIPAKGEEAEHPELTPPELVKELSRCKAAEVAPAHEPDTITLGADTIVVLDGKVLGKPHSEQEAFDMLRSLSGRSHIVYTGVTLIRGETVLSHAERSDVRFRSLSDEEIRRYIATGEPMDKAGAYGAQGYASLFVEGIDGDFFNVMGLPLCAMGKMFKELGVNLL